MATRVLVPMDGSDQAWTAWEFALREYPDAELVVLHVIDPASAGYSAQMSLPSVAEEWYERARDEAQDLFERVRDAAGERDATVTTDTVVGKPASAIVEYADEHEVDHVVMGSHGRSGVSRILLGSVAESVVRKSPVPVTVAR
ncbi:MAG: universal stress protein [Halorientalis sp.]